MSTTDTTPYRGFWRPHGALGCAAFGHDWSRWFIDEDSAKRMCKCCYVWEFGDGERVGPFS